MEWLPVSVFVIACVYGIGASILFSLSEQFKTSGWAYLVYVFGFFWLVVHTGMAAMGGPAGPAMAGVILAVVALIVVVCCNAVALFHALDFGVQKIGEGAMGLGQIRYRRTHDRALAAEARDDMEEAIRLYRADLKQDPEDVDGRRMLAEALAKAGRPAEAADELREVIERSESKEQRYSAIFRLAEITQEELERPGEAENLYRLILQEDPNSKYAEYAASRLRAGEPSEAPTDF